MPLQLYLTTSDFESGTNPVNIITGMTAPSEASDGSFYVKTGLEAQDLNLVYMPGE
jgi:hypothetical protein